MIKKHAELNVHTQLSSGTVCIMLSEGLSTSILRVCDKRRLWRNYVNAQASVRPGTLITEMIKWASYEKSCLRGSRKS